MKVRFLSSNSHKVEEATRILTPSGVQVVAAGHKINELQTDDVSLLLKDKATKAFERIGRRLFVEHTGLELVGLNGLPAGLTQVFWDRLQADRFVDLAAGLNSSAVVARTTIAYCDEKRIHVFEGAVKGSIASKPRGPRDFQWDCIFIPEGFTKTFAELGQEKDRISMRRIALDKFADYLKKEVPGNES